MAEGVDPPKRVVIVGDNGKQCNAIANQYLFKSKGWLPLMIDLKDPKDALKMLQLHFQKSHADVLVLDVHYKRPDMAGIETIYDGLCGSHKGRWDHTLFISVDMFSRSPEGTKIDRLLGNEKGGRKIDPLNRFNNNPRQYERILQRSEELMQPRKS